MEGNHFQALCTRGEANPPNKVSNCSQFELDEQMLAAFEQLSCNLEKGLFLVALLGSRGLISSSESGSFKHFLLASGAEEEQSLLVQRFYLTGSLLSVKEQLSEVTCPLKKQATSSTENEDPQFYKLEQKSGEKLPIRLESNQSVISSIVNFSEAPDECPTPALLLDMLCPERL